MDAVTIKNVVLAALSAAGSAIAHAMGGWDAVLALLICAMAADYITGMMVAAVWKRSPKSESGALESRAGFKGLCKKCVVLLMVWMAHLMDAAMGADYIRTAVILFFIGNEGLSLLENAGLMGVEYPPALRRALDALKDEGEEQKSRPDSGRQDHDFRA